MRMLDLIIKKRDGYNLTGEEIDFLVRGYTRGEIPDYQMAAWLMAVYLKGLTFDETRELTGAFIRSGARVDLTGIPGLKVDKHSTGGVGDKTTLVVVPLVTAAGVTVVKMSGRALGHTGGTLDKLESIPGFRVDLDLEEIREVASRVGGVIAGQTADLVPADKKIYALRDVTGTVDSLPLVVSSVMSKKIAAGADRIVLDVKVGSGGFMPELKRARQLADWAVRLGGEFNRPTVAVLSSMEQPLGMAVGNALEVREAITTLRGEGPPDLTRLSLTLGAQMLLAARVVTSCRAGYASLDKLLRNGAGLSQFGRIIAAQGGDPGVLEDPELLPKATRLVEIKAAAGGYIREIKARELGWVALLLGAGRLRREDPVDPAAGVMLFKKTGDRVAAGDTLAVLHVGREAYLAEAKKRAERAFVIAPGVPVLPPLIHEIVTPDRG